MDASRYFRLIFNLDYSTLWLEGIMHLDRRAHQKYPMGAIARLKHIVSSHYLPLDPRFAVVLADWTQYPLYQLLEWPKSPSDKENNSQLLTDIYVMYSKITIVLKSRSIYKSCWFLTTEINQTIPTYCSILRRNKLKPFTSWDF